MDEKSHALCGLDQGSCSAQGLSALDLTSEFDEKQVLEDNINYLIGTLQLDGIDVKFSTEANEKTQEECRPSDPFIVFR